MGDIIKITTDDLSDIKSHKQLKQLCQFIIDGVAEHNYHKDREFLLRAKELFIKHKLMFEAAHMTREIGISYYKECNAKRALNEIKAAVDTLKKNIFRHDRNDVLVNYMIDVAVIYYELLNYGESLLVFEKCSQKISDEIPKRFLYRYYYEYGILCIKIGRYQDAIDLFNKALEFSENDNTKKGHAYNNLCRCYRLMKQYKKSIKIFNKAMKYYGDDNNNLASAYNNASILYYNMNQMDKAFEYINKCFELFDKNNYKKYLIYYDTYVRIGAGDKEMDKVISRLLELLKLSYKHQFNKIHVLDPIKLIIDKLRKTNNQECIIELKKIITSLINDIADDSDSFSIQLCACLGGLSYLLYKHKKEKGGI